jgi:hypothetical protein
MNKSYNDKLSLFLMDGDVNITGTWSRIRRERNSFEFSRSCYYNLLISLSMKEMHSWLKCLSLYFKNHNYDIAQSV